MRRAEGKRYPLPAVLSLLVLAVALSIPISKAEKPCWGPRERPERLMQWLDCDVAELDRVVVAGETKEAGGPVLAGVGGVGHEVLDGAQVGVEDHGAVELDLDLRTLHGHLLEVPEANRALVADLGGNHAVGRTVVLAWVELAVEVDRGPRPGLDDPEGVPLADRVARQGQGVLAGVPGAVVPESARALVGTEVGIAGFGEIPDLDLRCAAEINAAVALGADLEIDEELDVAVILVGGQVDALAVVDDLAVFDTPMLLQVLRIPGKLLGLLVATEGSELPRIGGLLTVPAGQVLTVEEGDETAPLLVGPRRRRCGPYWRQAENE